MKHKLTFFSAAVFLGTAAIYSSSSTSNVDVAPYYSIRSQGVDVARELSGWTQHINLFDINKIYGAFALTAEYTQSFRSQSIASTLFGQALQCVTDCNDCDRSIINISGSRSANRGADDLLADNFYLPTDYKGTLIFSPRIQNVVVDLNFYLGLDAWCNGLFLRVDAPINWTSWNLNFSEQVCNSGINNYDAGYFNGYDEIPTDTSLNGTGVENSKLNHSFGAYARGKSPQGVVASGPESNAIIMDGLCYAKMDCGAHAVTRLADLQFILGWNFLDESENYHIGVGLLTRAPTGNRPNGKYLFEPISGNGGSWEFGAHITSHATLWRNKDEHSSLGLYIDANITHLFNAQQTRTFDLKDKPLSRYMLASKFGATADNVANTGNALAGGTTTDIAIAPNYQFANAFTPVANLTTRQVHVSVGAQGDLAAQLTYVNGGWNWDIGYNFWGRSCEKFKCENDCIITNTAPCNNPCNTTCFDSCINSCNSSCSSSCPTSFVENKFGLKGDAYVYGFAISDVPANTVSVPLSATESSATIRNGTNFAAIGASTNALVAAGQINPDVDNKQLAFHGTNGEVLDATPSGVNALDVPGDQTNTSINPILLSACNFNHAGTRGISNKFYTHLNYNWLGCKTLAPYVGVGAFGEFGNSKSCDSCPSSCYTNCNTTTNCPNTNSHGNSCSSTALSQWGVWIKGGLAFN